MWFLLAILSAIALGFYDIAKKRSLTDNPVAPVLLLSICCSCVLLAPMLIVSRLAPGTMEGSLFYVPHIDLTTHLFIALKSVIVLASWVFAYVAMKHLPITLVTPVNATRPMWTLIGALLIFDERLTGWQWAGVVATFGSLMLFSLVERREGIDFTHNKWVVCLAIAILLGAMSGLYDKHLMRRYDHNAVQVFYTFYQAVLMAIVTAIIWWPHRHESPLHWRWSIALIALFLVISDFVYLLALSYPESLVSVVSIVRRSSVIVSFAYGAMMLHERNITAKAFCLVGVLAGMLCLFIGSL